MINIININVIKGMIPEYLLWVHLSEPGSRTTGEVVVICEANNESEGVGKLNGRKKSPIGTSPSCASRVLGDR